MSKMIIAHDLGTSGNKATLFTTEGELLASAVYPYEARFSDGNRAEQNPNLWWKAFCATNKELLAGRETRGVAAVSFSGQMMGCLCVDKQGIPLRESIIWADMRAQKEADEIAAKIDPQRFYCLTGHRNSSSYSAQKLMWVKRNQPDVYRQTHKMLGAKDYLIHKLTGRFLTEPSDASGTNLFDINTLKWSEELVEAAGLDPDKLPRVVPSTEVAGEISPTVGEECGLPAGTKVVMGGGDGVCASVGAGSVTPGVVYNCLGTSSWVSTTTKAPILDPQMRTFNFAHIVPGLVNPCGAMQAAGLSYNWAIQTLYGGELAAAEKNARVYELANRELAAVPALAGGLVFLPYLIGERSPRWNPNARGAFVGLTPEHGRGEMMRSVVEGIALNLRIILDVFRQAEKIGEVTLIGGLAQGEIIRQILADVFEADVKMPNRVQEATSIGAAVTAGVGAGLLKDFSEVSRFAATRRKTAPNPENARAYRAFMPVYNRAYNQLIPVFDSLGGL